MKAFLVAASLAAVLVATVAASPVAAGASPESIQQCLHGGWQSLVRDDGTPFENQGACASYLARGGTLGCPAPAAGAGPLIAAHTVGAGHVAVTGSGFTTFGAYSAIEVTLDGCGTVRFYNFESWGFAVPGGNLGQACPSIGNFWQDETINLRCNLIAGRTVRAITIYDAFGSPAGHLDIADVAVPPMPTFAFGSTVESAPQQLTLPVLTTNAEGISALQIHYVPNAPGYTSCGSGSEFYFPYFEPSDPLANPDHPIRVVTWSGGAITLDFSNLVESEAYPGGFTLCGVVAYWGSYIAVGTAFPAAPFTFYG
ncbi:MAG: hypothetical protein ACRDPX_04950 [Gaiellaceae bacterium]